jgi:hypothetical protein
VQIASGVQPLWQWSKIFPSVPLVMESDGFESGWAGQHACQEFAPDFLESGNLVSSSSILTIFLSEGKLFREIYPVRKSIFGGLSYWTRKRASI